MFIPDRNITIAKYPVHGQAVTDGTATVIGTPHEVRNGVIVQALSTNATSVWVGGSAVTSSNGFELQPGQATSVGVDNLNQTYVIGTSGNGICFVSSSDTPYVQETVIVTPIVAGNPIGLLLSLTYAS